MSDGLGGKGAPEGAPFLSLQGISKSFGGVKALRDVDFQVSAGQIHCIAGENGAGKSTLIKTIMGVLRPDQGTMLVDGEAVEVESPAAARSLGFAAVHQEPMVYPEMTVLENLFMGAPMRNRFGSLDSRAMRRRAEPVLDELGLPSSVLSARMRDLRLGHQQLALIAEALIRDAKLLILDEPTSILSATESEHLFEIMRRLRDSDRAIVYISHRLEELEGLVDAVTVLTDGAVVGKMQAGAIDIGELLHLISGVRSRTFVKHVTTAAELTNNEVVFEVRGLTLEPIYRDISWKVRSGEVLGFYGQVGSGRTEMALGVFGAMPPTSGTILLQGNEVSPSSPRGAIELGIGYVPEDRKSQGIFASQSIAVNATAVILRRLIGRFHQVRRSALFEVAKRFQDSFTIKLRDLSDPITSLSGGGQQKVMLARWLAEQPKALIVDEPTRGVDVGTKDEFHRLIREIARAGTAVVVISSDLPEILAVSDRIVVLRDGKVVKEIARPSEVAPEELVGHAVGTVGEGQVADGDQGLDSDQYPVSESTGWPGMENQKEVNP